MAELTEAEATDGKLVFDVVSPDDEATRQVTHTIPVLGSYSETWPLHCEKSRIIIEQAAAFYADTKLYPDGSDQIKGVSPVF